MRLFLIAACFAFLSTAALAQMVSAPLDALDETPFRLVSVDMTDENSMPDMHMLGMYGCTGKNQSPTLSWSYPPEGTKSFAITMFDETARDGDGWLHWAVLNIPEQENILRRDLGAANNPYPDGAVLIPNSWGRAQYDGPCPPPAERPHKYVFTIYAMPEETIAYPLSSLGWSTIDWLTQQALGTASIAVKHARPVTGATTTLP